jgi:predicted transglutaminase-like protease
MAIVTQAQLVTNLNNILSNNKNPLTRGGELNSFLKDFIDTIFQNKVTYSTTISNATVTEIPYSIHLLPFVTGVRVEDLSGNEMFIPNKIDTNLNKVTLYSDSSISFKVKLF